MFEKDDCNFDFYQKLIKMIKDTGRYMDFSEAIDKDAFIVARHDIEFSIGRAYNMALVEAENDFYTSYFVQITNNAYNPFSKKNLDLLKAIIAMGHKIGLHYHTNGEDDISIVCEQIKDQAEILSRFTGTNIDRFSFHRPSPALLQSDMRVEGLFNTYSRLFFTYTNNLDSLKDTDVHYLSDSNHQWKFGQPTAEWIKNHPKIQCLFHPMSWTFEGSNHLDCFKSLAKEKKEEFLETVKNEWKYYYLLEEYM